MKTIRKKIEVLGMKYDPEGKWFNVNMGSLVFHLSNNKIKLDETPYYDEHLVSIENLKTDKKLFTFNSFYKKQYTLFNVDCSTYIVGINLAKCIMYINENNLEFNEQHDFFDFFFQKEELHLSLKNKIKKEYIVIGFNEYRNYFSLVYPEPGKEFLIDKCIYSNKTIYIKCKGLNLWDDKDHTSDLEYEWKLNLPIEIETTLDLLLKYVFQSIG
jgi:hypothetical protein